MSIKSILIDNREPQHIQGITFNNVPVAVTQLKAGDVWVACDDDEMLVIERKTPSDLLESIKDNRLFNQVAAMREVSQWCYLVCEGQLQPHDTGFEVKVWADNKQRDWHYSSVQGALLSVQELGCGVIFCAGPDWFWACIERLAKRSRTDVKIPPRRQAHVFGGQEALLACLPGVGSKKALEYLKLFQGNLALALTAMTAEHDGKKNHIPKYGKKSRDNVVGFLGGRLEYKTDGN